MRRRALLGIKQGGGSGIDTSNYLTFHSLSDDCKIRFAYKTIEYYLETEGEWKQNDINKNISIPNGTYMCVRGSNAVPGQTSNSATVKSEGTFSLSGNIMSLIHGDDAAGKTSISGNYAFNFYFQGCTGLVSAKDLKLPATTLSSYCYRSMFYGCTSLVDAPELPATTLATYCYSNMFYNCTNLTTAPELPATTLATYCYYYMFYNCTNLTTAPELPATSLVSNCYRSMFVGCSKLSYIKALFTTTPTTSYTRDWVSGVASSGTFVKNKNATWNVIGIYGVPSGWTIQTA